MTKTHLAKTLLAAFAVALLGAAPAAAQADFTIYVALGDSLTAGFASGGLTQFYQERSYPATLARQAVAFDFQMPIITNPGLPPLLELFSLAPSTVIGTPPGTAPGQPINLYLARPYNNLGVPGSTLFDMLFTTGNATNLQDDDPTNDDPMHDLILRMPTATALVPPPGTNPCDDSLWVPVEIPAPAITQAIGLGPTFVTMWIGNNDALGAALYGTVIEGQTLTPLANFQAMYKNALETLVQYLVVDRITNPCGFDNLGPGSEAGIVVMTIPDVTSIPFVTTLAPYANVPGVGRVPFIGPMGPIPEDHYLTLNASAFLAQGIGIPVELGGTGQPLPDDMVIVGGQVVAPGVILRPDEIATISGRIDDFNEFIRHEVADVNGWIHDVGGGGYNVLLLDVNQIFGEIAHGEPMEYGGITLGAGFLTGGLFSYDGVHPQSVGYAVIANELIKVINDGYGAAIPEVNMHAVLNEGGADTIIPDGAMSAAFSESAMMQLLEAFPLVGQAPELQTGPGAPTTLQ